MGHRFSKSPANTCETATATNGGAINSSTCPDQQVSVASGCGNRGWSEFLPIPSTPQTINLQIQEEEAEYETVDHSDESIGNNNTTSSSHRQIIIKIQLAKMVNDNNAVPTDVTTTTTNETNGNAASWDSNCNETAGSFSNDLNRNNPLLNRMDLLTMEQRRADEEHPDAASQRVLLRNRDSSLNESVEYIEVLEAEAEEESATPQQQQHVAVCCRCQKSKRRCCKCTCRDAFRRILEPSSKSHKTKSPPSATAKHSKSLARHSLQPSGSGHRAPANRASVPATPHQSNNNSATAVAQNQLAIWTGGGSRMGPCSNSSAATASRNDVLIPLNPPFLVVQCPARTSVVTVGGLDERIRLVATEFVADSNTTTTTAATATTTTTVGAPATTNRLKTSFGANGGPIVHSQVDFVHYLVPDLEKITNSSFYWGKMDRYEAERLLEGKPEGTFLLRDSAQEEFLFSVTFRKYGRSLHARIEQSGHKFSFDCHDPSVFTALTVTGLLEHYKDPACVMFFEPMLTIPLHRAKPFSLQQLCRASIVSHTTYDGINEMELPSPLKAYLKEYHYKQKLRVKPFDEPFYTCT